MRPVTVVDAADDMHERELRRGLPNAESNKIKAFKPLYGSDFC